MTVRREREEKKKEKARTLEMLEPVGLSEVLGGEDGRVEEHEDDHEPVEELRFDEPEGLGAAEAVQLSQALAARNNNNNYIIIIIHVYNHNAGERATTEQ